MEHALVRIGHGILLVWDLVTNALKSVPARARKSSQSPVGASSRLSGRWNGITARCHICTCSGITKAFRVGASFSTSRSEPGIMGEGLGGGRGVPILEGFCSCPAGHGRFSGVGFWVVFGQDSRSPFWVSFGRFSGACQEAHEGIWGLFWACLELIVGRRASVPRPVHCRVFVPARGSQVSLICGLLLGGSGGLSK